MIRKETTKVSKERKAEWEMDIMSKPNPIANLQRVEGAVKYWEKMAEKAESGQLKTSELEELELLRRISASTEGVTPESQRLARFERLKRIDKANEAIRAEKTGQSEEEYQKELEDLNKKYQRALNS